MAMKDYDKKQEQEIKLKEVSDRKNTDEKLKKVIKEKINGLNNPFNK